MYPNSCMYLQSWNSHLVEMDNLPLSRISKSFGATRDMRRSGRASCRTNTRSHLQAGDDQSSPGLTGTAGPGWAGLPEMQPQLLGQRPRLLPVIPVAWNWDHPMWIYTQMIQFQQKNPIQTTLSVAQTPSHCFTLATVNSGRCSVGDLYGMLEAPPMHNSDKKISCWVLCHSSLQINLMSNNTAWSLKHVKISNLICSAICNNEFISLITVS